MPSNKIKGGYMPKQAKEMGDMGALYDHEAKPFANKSQQLVWWVTLGAPAYDRHLKHFYGKRHQGNITR